MKPLFVAFICVELQCYNNSQIEHQQLGYHTKAEKNHGLQMKLLLTNLGMSTSIHMLSCWTVSRAAFIVVSFVSGSTGSDCGCSSLEQLVLDPRSIRQRCVVAKRPKTDAVGRQSNLPVSPSLISAHS